MLHRSFAFNFRRRHHQIARPGIAFRYTASGPEGLLPNKKMYIVSSSGGGPPSAVACNGTDPVRAVLRRYNARTSTPPRAAARAVRGVLCTPLPP